VLEIGILAVDRFYREMAAPMKVKKFSYDRLQGQSRGRDRQYGVPQKKLAPPAFAGGAIETLLQPMLEDIDCITGCIM
jgi:hypothetical protein